MNFVRVPIDDPRRSWAPWFGGRAEQPSDMYQTSIEHLSKTIYLTSIGNLSKTAIEQPSNSISRKHRRSIEHLSSTRCIRMSSLLCRVGTGRTTIGHWSNSYRLSIEHILNNYRTSVQHLPNSYRSNRNIFRTPMEIYRACIDNWSNNCIEHLLSVETTYVHGVSIDKGPLLWLY